MAQAVEQALEEKRHLIVEAGTGTGKTLAYLMPVIRSGKRVIISTGTKNLQEQLFYKDVPFLERALVGDHVGTVASAVRREGFIAAWYSAQCRSSSCYDRFLWSTYALFSDLLFPVRQQLPLGPAVRPGS